MRIIGGKFGGRKFIPPAKNWPTRPTTDFSKEGLFNILQNKLNFEDAKMLDLFGGTGNHCYEFISRGCENATYVDNFPPAVQFVRQTAKVLDIEMFIHIVQMDVFKFIEANPKGAYSYIFAGPPYPLKTLDMIPDKIFGHEILAFDGLFVLEHNPDHNFDRHVNFIQKRKYGTTIFSFFQHNQPQNKTL